tara:strand:+ start:8208 stop:8831 length:624 start_codon:yes stop_codon:yes gene_type:complete
MSTITALKTLINNQLNRGTIYDAVLDDYIRAAGKFFEQNYTFRYMKSFTSVNGTSGVRTLAMPSALVKSFNSLRIANTDGNYLELFQVEPGEIISNGAGDPGYFWLDGRDTLYFDNTPDRVIAFEFDLVEFTDWSATVDATTNWLLDVGQTAMQYQTLIYLAVADRDAALMQMAQAMFGPALNTLLAADEALEQSVREGISHYHGES